MSTITVSAAAVDDTLTVDDVTLTGTLLSANGTLTPVSAVADNTFTVASTVFTLLDAGESPTDDAASSALPTVPTKQQVPLGADDAAQAVAIAEAVNLAIGDRVRARAASGVVYVRAVATGTAGNAYTLAQTGDTITVSAGTFADGEADGALKFDVSGDDVVAAASIAAKLSSAGFVASSAGAVVTVVRADGTHPAVSSSDAATLACSMPMVSASRLRLTPFAAAPDEGEVGDLINVAGELATCTVAQSGETPATYVVVGTQS